MADSLGQIFYHSSFHRFRVNTAIVLDSLRQSIARRLDDYRFFRIAEFEPGRITGLDIYQLVNNGVFHLGTLVFTKFSRITQEC